MLVLSRQEGESIVINNNTVVTVRAIVGNRVILACEAPKQIPIWRGEVHLQRISEREGTAETQE